MNVLTLAVGLTMLFEFYVGWEVLMWLERLDTLEAIEYYGE